MPTEASFERPRKFLSLREAIHIAIANSEVIRVAAGDGVASSGRTIYDPAVTNTTIDRARSRFDPSYSLQNTFSRNETPSAVPTLAPPYADFRGEPVDSYQFSTGLSKQTLMGGQASMAVNANPSRSPDPNWPLSPTSPSSVEFALSQPLLLGAGRDVNTAPITITVLQTEQSFLQLKGSTQQLVRSVIQLYWSLVAAKVDLWTLEQQINSAQLTWEQADANDRFGRGDKTARPQALVSLMNLKAQRVSARTNVLNREQAIRNILGMPPAGPEEIVPTTFPNELRVPWGWEEIQTIALDNRPDLAQLRLSLRVDRQDMLVSENRTLPDLSVNAAYRFNHLTGKTVDNSWIDTAGGKYASWRLGLDLAVPLGQRDARAEMRESQLVYARDRAKYMESLHQTRHELARTYRNLDQYLQEYKAYSDAIEPALENYDIQKQRFDAGLNIYLNVLQAIASWGSITNSKAQALLRYNTEVALLQEEMGVILEENGVFLRNNYFCSLGPGGRMGADRAYPRSVDPMTGEPTEPAGDTPSERYFNLTPLDANTAAPQPTPGVSPNPPAAQQPAPRPPEFMPPPNAARP